MLKPGPGAVAHSCNPSYLVGGDLEDLSSRPPSAKTSTILTNKLGMS
jgi:hypothetical protein